jgi:histidinol-phosphatase (PHP family)
MKITGNYHTHTYRCKHASGDVSDYARDAVHHGLSDLGMSDHTPLPDNRWDFVRMDMDELPAYGSAIDKARRSFPEITIYKGLECEWTEEYHAFYQELLYGRGFDYLIGCMHWIPHRGGWDDMADLTGPHLVSYASHLMRTMESGLFSFIAHPDIFGAAYPRWDENCEACSRDILSAAEDLQVPLEINGYGFRKPEINTSEGPRLRYPWPPFWRLASEYDITVVVNSDAHDPEDTAASLQDAAELAEECGLLIDYTPLEPAKRSA